MNRNTWIIIIVAVIVIIGLIWIFNRGSVAETGSQAQTVPGALIVTDPATGCQYLRASSGITPRLDKFGKQMCGAAN